MLGPLTKELLSCCPNKEKEAVSNYLEAYCSTNLPGIGTTEEWIELIDRVQLAAIRGSGWSLYKIKEAAALANRDWRDLLVAAGFANSLSAHKQWQKHALQAKDVS